MVKDITPDDYPKYCPQCKHLLHQEPAQPFKVCYCGCLGAAQPHIRYLIEQNARRRERAHS